MSMLHIGRSEPFLISAHEAEVVPPAGGRFRVTHIAVLRDGRRPWPADSDRPVGSRRARAARRSGRISRRAVLHANPKRPQFGIMGCLDRRRYDRPARQIWNTFPRRIIYCRWSHDWQRSGPFTLASDILVRRRGGCDAFACFAEMVGGGPAARLDSQPRRSFVVRSDGLHDIASMVGMVLNHF